jgi:hypothetical protein
VFAKEINVNVSNSFTSASPPPFVNVLEDAPKSELNKSSSSSSSFSSLHLSGRTVSSPLLSSQINNPKIAEKDVDLIFPHEMQELTDRVFIQMDKDAKG